MHQLTNRARVDPEATLEKILGAYAAAHPRCRSCRVIWFMNGATRKSYVTTLLVTDLSWEIQSPK